MAKETMIVLENKGAGRTFDLLHAQRILQWQVRNPRIKDLWTIKKGEPFEFVNDELVGNGNTKKGNKPEGKG